MALRLLVTSVNAAAPTINIKMCLPQKENFFKNFSGGVASALGVLIVVNVAIVVVLFERMCLCVGVCVCGVSSVGGKA